MKLHLFPSSTSSRTVLLFCAEANIAFEPVIVDLRTGANRADAFLALNPSGFVPVLEDDGFVLTECSAILKYLADKHGSPAYPTELRARARVNERMDWVNTQLVRDWLHHLIYPQVLPTHRRSTDDAQRSIVEWGKQKSEHWLTVLDRHLLGGGAFLCGDAISIADYFAAEIAWSGSLIGVRFDRYPSVDRWMATMRALPSWAKVNEAVDALAAAQRDKSFITIA